MYKSSDSSHTYVEQIKYLTTGKRWDNFMKFWVLWRLKIDIGRVRH